MALRLSSSSHIVSSSDPMNSFLSTEGKNCNYLVMGLQQCRKNKKEWVTIHKVWDSEGKKFPENYLLCLSHALFKMVKRRCVNLYLQERIYKITRKFLFAEGLSHISADEIFTVAEMEMKFLYDLLFSKSSGTAFSKLGAAIRLVNICLLGVSEFLIYRELRSRRVAEEVLYKQRVVAFVLLSVALVLEVVQFCRIWASDWTIVWLICEGIRHTDSSSRKIGLDLYMPMLIQIAIQISSCFRKFYRGKYWKDQIPQYSIIHTSSQLSPRIWKLSKLLRLTRFLTAWYTLTEPLGDDLKHFILEKLKERCLTEEEEEEDDVEKEKAVEKCRQRLTKYNSILDENDSKDLTWASDHGHEFLILRWHIATTICEKEFNERGAEKDRVKKNVDVSRKLSGYCAHLLVSTPNLLPLHPQGAHLRHMEVHDDLFKHGVNRLESLSFSNKTLLSDGAELARKLQDKPEEQRWKVISDYWGGLMIFYAMKNKASIHTKRLAVGGEFLTLLWAILGHMGVGDQWETSGL